MAQQATTAEPSRKRTFWIPDALYERVRARIGDYRQSEGMSVNRFVREAIEASLAKKAKQ